MDKLKELGEPYFLQIPQQADRKLWLPQQRPDDFDFFTDLLPPETDGYGTGLIRPPQGIIAPSALLVPRIRAQKEVGIPDQADNSVFCEQSYNQGQTPKCSAYSASGILSAMKRKQHGPGNWWRFDADRLFQEGGGSDQGGIMQAMDTVLDQMGGLRVDDQRRYKEMSWAQVPNVSGVWEDTICAAIAAGGFVHQATLVWSGFGSQPNGALTQGYHAVFLTAYRKTPQLQFRFMNSWGSSFGQQGFAWADAEAFTQRGFQQNFAYSLTLVDAPDAGVVPTPTPTPTPTPGGFVQQVLDLTNQARVAAGLGPLRLQSQLMASSQGYAIQLAAGIPFSHTGPDGSTPFSRMHAAGYTGGVMGENIARGFGTPQDVMTAWMNSPGHRANILYAAYTQIGIGVAGDSWVQDFGAGGSDDEGPTPPPPTPPVPPIPPPASLTVGVNATASGIAVTINRPLPTGTMVNVGVREPDGTTASGTATVGGVTPPTPVPPVPPVPPIPGGPTIDLTAPEPVTAGGLLTIRGSNFGGGPGRVVFYPGPLGRVNLWNDTMVQVFVPLNAGRGPNLIELDTVSGQKVTKIIAVS